MMPEMTTIAALESRKRGYLGRQLLEEQIDPSDVKPAGEKRSFKVALDIFAKEGFQLRDKLAYRHYQYITAEGFIETAKHYFLYLLAGGVFGDTTRSLPQVDAAQAGLRFYGQCCKVQQLYQAFQGNRNDETYTALAEAFEKLHTEFDRTEGVRHTDQINEVLVKVTGADVSKEILTYFAKHKLVMDKDFYVTYEQVLKTKEQQGYSTNILAIDAVFSDIVTRKIVIQMVGVLQSQQPDKKLEMHGIRVQDQQNMLNETLEQSAELEKLQQDSDKADAKAAKLVALFQDLTKIKEEEEKIQTQREQKRQDYQRDRKQVLETSCRIIASIEKAKQCKNLLEFCLQHYKDKMPIDEIKKAQALLKQTDTTLEWLNKGLNTSDNNLNQLKKTYKDFKAASNKRLLELKNKKQSRVIISQGETIALEQLDGNITTTAVRQKTEKRLAVQIFIQNNPDVGIDKTTRKVVYHIKRLYQSIANIFAYNRQQFTIADRVVFRDLDNSAVSLEKRRAIMILKTKKSGRTRQKKRRRQEKKPIEIH